MADLRVPTQNYKGHHPGRLKVRQYYISNKLTYTREERQEFILALAACDELVWDGVCDDKENVQEEDDVWNDEEGDCKLSDEDSTYTCDERDTALDRCLLSYYKHKSYKKHLQDHHNIGFSPRKNSFIAFCAKTSTTRDDELRSNCKPICMVNTSDAHFE